MNKDKNNSAINKGRRHFFRMFLGEAVSFVDEIKGKPQLRLDELDQVPDHIVRKMIPTANSGDYFRFTENSLFIKERSSSEFKEVYRLNNRQKEIVDFFDSNHTLEEIADLFAREYKENPEEIYLQVKSVFFKLAKYAVYYPADPHEHNRES